MCRKKTQITGGDKALTEIPQLFYLLKILKTHSR